MSSDAALLIACVIFFGLLIFFMFLDSTLTNSYAQKRLEDFKEGRITVPYFHLQDKKEKKVTVFDVFVTRVRILLEKYNKNISGSMRLRFEQCGLSPKSAPYVIPLFRITSLVVFLGSYASLNYFVPAVRNQLSVVKYMILIVFVILGYRSFDYFLDILKKSRYANISKNLPNGIDLLVSCTRGGLNIERSFERLSREMLYDNPELAKEFAVTAAELGILPERRMAFENLMQRVELPLMKGLCISLIQAESQGVSIAHTLQILAQEFTKKQLLEIETRASRLPALLSLPILLFSLPALMIIILGPAVSQITTSALYGN
ncbi:MAG: hypothetical protein C0514_00635 [Candidatus Puniceispirillum sp.]|nr:hypothetical protein [Candidatus Puniceispirillum sp.]